jgi:hypothetical protein
VNPEPNYDRVADVFIHVALRMTEHDETKAKGEVDVDTGVLSRLDRGTG